MADKKIDVIAYAGFKGEEAPRTFVLGGWKVEIVEITGMWVEEEPGTRKRRRFFDLTGDDGLGHTLYYDETSSEWFYRSRKQT